MIEDSVHLGIGSLLFEGVDQVDLTDPFEVPSRFPNSGWRKTRDIWRSHQRRLP